MTSSEILLTIAEWLVERGAVQPLYEAIYDGSPDDVLDVDGMIIQWLADPDVSPDEIIDVLAMIFPAADKTLVTQVHQAIEDMLQSVVRRQVPEKS